MRRPRRGGRLALVSLVFACTFAVLAGLAAVHRVNDPDVFWLARAGGDLLASGAAPTRNVYAFTDPNAPWVLHEAAFAVVFFEGMKGLGPAFASLIGLVFAAAMVGAAMFLVVRGCRSVWRASFGALLILLVAPALFEPRPAYLAVAFVIAMVALAFSPGWTAARAFACVALEVLWTHAHGSFPLGLVLLGVSALDHAEPRRERALRAATTALAALSTLANPYGAELYVLVARYLVGIDETARLFHENVVEFFSLLRAIRTPYVHAGQVLALVAAAVLAVHAAVRREKLARAILVLCMVVATLYQARHLTLAVVIAVLLLVPDGRRMPDVRLARARAMRALRLATLTVAPGLVLGVGLWGLSMRTRSSDDWIAPSLGGASFARLVRELPQGAKVYAPFQPSALLLWVGAAAGARVFFDPRNDCYSPRVAKMAFALESADVPPSVVLDSLAWARTEYAIVPVGGAVSRALQGSPSWALRRADDGWALLALR